jgi:4-alpha-glucanotransferase
MRFARSSGILLHPTSLSGRYGIGDLGLEARRFVDFLASSGQTVFGLGGQPAADQRGKSG